MSGRIIVALAEDDAEIVLDVLTSVLDALCDADDDERAAIVSAAGQLRQGLQGRS